MKYYIVKYLEHELDNFSKSFTFKNLEVAKDFAYYCKEKNYLDVFEATRIEY